MPFSENPTQRTSDAVKLVEDFNLKQDAEFFADPSNRIELLTTLSADDFFDLAKHTNDRVRGFEPKERSGIHEEGGFLPLLATPEPEDKRVAFRAGYDAIKDYLVTTDDSMEQKIKGASMAVEALVIWVHPFDDGNGRTSRFLGKFVEDGTTDVEQLIAETADINQRLRMFDGDLRVDQGNTIKGIDIILDDDERKEYEKTEMPAAEGISLSIKRLLEDKTIQAAVDAKQVKLTAAREKFPQKLAA